MAPLNSILNRSSIPLTEIPNPAQRAGELARGLEKGKDDKALRKVSREFESIFLNMMLKEMRSAVPKFDPLHSYAEETYQELMDQEWARDMVKNRSVGLADMVYRQLSKLEGEPAL